MAGRIFLQLSVVCLLRSWRVQAAPSPPRMPKPVEDEFNRLSQFNVQGCGACVAAGGAWCTAGSRGRCVPDAIGMCSDPSKHAGIVGTARCSGSDFEWQAYYHAPRRQPLEPSATLQQGSCEDRCTAETTATDLQSAVRKDIAAAFHDCGAAVLLNVSEPRDLLHLRGKLLRTLELATGADAAIAGKAAKYQIPGVRGNSRAEIVLPATPEFTDAVRSVFSRDLTRVLESMLGHPPAMEFASVMTSWPGAAAQPFHRDAEPGSEAALFLFVPLENMSVDGNGPPELCECTHHPKATVAETECPGPRLVVDAATAPIGSAVVYEPGLVHRGLSNRATLNNSRATPRLMLHLVVAPQRSFMRARPEKFMTLTAQNHIRRWRGMSLPASTSPCDTFTSDGCTACIGSHLDDEGYRTGCSWCVETSECVPDLAGMCPGGPHKHLGKSGLGGLNCERDSGIRTEL